MNILCTTDFSTVSINAIEWIFDMLNDGEFGGNVEIIHCVDTMRRSDMFVSLDYVLKDKAIDDMKILEQKFTNLQDNINVKTSVHNANSKTFISKYAESKKFDLIVTGTTGLTGLKDIVVGSVTEYISKNCKVPLLTIPAESKFIPIKNVVIALGKDEMKNANNLSHLYNFLEPHNPRVFLTQVLKKEHHTISVDLRIEKYLKDLTYEFMPLEEKGSINITIDEFCKKVKAEILCMVHYRRNWISNLIHKSITKEELFSIERPLLIIPV